MAGVLVLLEGLHEPQMVDLMPANIETAESVTACQSANAWGLLKSLLQYK